MDKLIYYALSASLALASIALSINFASGLQSISRNAETSNTVFTLTLIGAAFIEFVILILLAMAFVV